GHCNQGRISTRATSADLDTSRIDVTAVGEEADCSGAVLDIDLAPAAAQAVAIFAPVSRTASVVEIDDGDTTAGEELDRQLERIRHVGRRAAVHMDEQRRLLVVGAQVVAIPGWVVERVRGQAV